MGRSYASLLAAMIVLGGAVTGPAAAGVLNPGSITLRLVDATITVGHGTPEFDLMPCEPALAPECEPGRQITLSGTITETGALTIPASQAYFPSRQVEVADMLVQIGIVATSDIAGVIDPHTGLVTAGMSLRISLVPVGLAIVCDVTLPSLGLSSANLDGVDYDQNTGLATATAESFQVLRPGISVNPQSLLCPPIISGLGLAPAAPGPNFASFTFQVDPVVKGLVADAGPSRSNVPAGEALTLDATGSADAEGEEITYSWKQVSGPASILSNPASPTPVFTPTQPLTHLVFELTVTNESGLSDTDTTAVSVGFPRTGGASWGHDVFNEERCDFYGGVWENDRGAKSCTVEDAVVDVFSVELDEGTILVDESDLPDGPRTSPQYRGEVGVILTHVVHRTYLVETTTEGTGRKGNPRPGNKKETEETIAFTDQIVHTSVITTQLTCQRRTLGLLAWSPWTDRGLTECSSRGTFQYPAVLRGVEFSLP